MSAERASLDPAGPRRSVPTVWRILVSGDIWIKLTLAFAILMGVHLAVGLMLSRRVDWVGVACDVALILTAVFLNCWLIARVRRTFARRAEVRGRIIHLQRFELSDNPASPVGGPAAHLRVVYLNPVSGQESVAEYTLDADAIDRLHASIGAEVVLLLNPELEVPLLRDIYVGR